MPSAPILRGRSIFKLSEEFQDIGKTIFQSNGLERTITQMIDNTYTDGMLIYQAGEVIHENYYNGMSKRSLHLCQSVSKSKKFCIGLSSDTVLLKQMF